MAGERTRIKIRTRAVDWQQHPQFTSADFPVVQPTKFEFIINDGKGRVGMRRQWTFFLYIALAAATAMPALGQTIASESGPASAVTNGAASIPDFTGVWTPPAFPWFEPP